MFLRSADTDDARWLMLLSRLALLSGVFSIVVFALFGFGVMPAGLDATLGEDYTMLVAAMHAPAIFHLTHLFDALSWLISIGFWLTFALLAARRAPARGMLLVAIGCGMAFGLAGTLIRGMGTSAIAEHYPTATATDQAAARFMFLGLQLTAIGLMNAGSLLAGIGYAVAASAARSMAQFPRWLVVLIALPAVLELSKQLFQLVTGMDIGEVLLLQLPFELVLYFALAWRFWRPTAAPATELQGIPAN